MDYSLKASDNPLLWLCSSVFIIQKLYIYVDSFRHSGRFFHSKMCVYIYIYIYI